jgi:hypothetical protein
MTADQKELFRADFHSKIYRLALRLCAQFESIGIAVDGDTILRYANEAIDELPGWREFEPDPDALRPCIEAAVREWKFPTPA